MPDWASANYLLPVDEAKGPKSAESEFDRDRPWLSEGWTQMSPRRAASSAASTYEWVFAA
ncbi:hypothetical protein GCM10009813_09300 [Brevibacterium marinum]